jgi:hypothetical protein
MAHQLRVRTFGKTAKAEIASILPDSHAFVKRHVPGCGYVHFIKNASGKTIAKCYKVPMKTLTLEIATGSAVARHLF